MKDIESLNISDNVSLINQISEIYFNGYRSVKIIQFSEFLGNELNDIPIEVYSEMSTLKYEVPMDVAEYEKLIGYIFKVETRDNLNERIKDMSEINPLTRILLVASNFELNDVQNSLKQAWNSYQMLNILIVSMNLSNFNETIIVSTYNPFTTTHLSLQIDLETVIHGMDMILDFMERRLKNLNEYPIKITIFEDPGICKLVTSEDDNKIRKKYTYQDGETIDIISRIMNFYPNYTTNPDGANFGSHIGDGDEYNGAMQDLFTGTGEVAANARIITNVHRTNFFIFLNWCTTLNLNFVVPARFYEYNFDVFPHSFYDKWIMALICFSFISITLMYYLVEYFDFKMLEKSDINFSLIRLTLNVMSLLNNIQLMIFPGSNQLKQCILFGSFLLITLNINSIYQGTIITELNSKSQFGEINSIQQLLDTNLTIYVNAHITEFLSPYKDFDEATIYRRMYERQNLEISQFSEQLNLTSINRTAAFLTPEIYIPTYQASSFENGVQRIHEIKETPMKYYLALTIPKKSPYIERFNEIIDRIVAAGIVNYQTDRAIADAELEYIKKIKENGIKGDELKLLGMKELKSLFYVYMLLCGFATLVFGLEFLMHIWAHKSKIVKEIENYLETNHAS
uniref:CSON011386 protein n=1 Tax=Culicoides sonorensis TaxID=179676 RepID=A0A336KTW7_CULSO